MNKEHKCNPGKNVKGQAPRAKTHHKGKVDTTYISDPQKRSQALYKRLTTLKKKVKELSDMTGTDITVQWKTESGSSGTYTSSTISVDAADGEVPSTSSATTVCGPEKPEDEDSIYPDPPLPAERDDDESENVTGSSVGTVKRRRLNQSITETDDTDKCCICQCARMSKQNEIWLNCEHRKCNYWVHCVCKGIVVKNETQLHDVKFFCPQHIKKFMLQ